MAGEGEGGRLEIRKPRPLQTSLPASRCWRHRTSAFEPRRASARARAPLAAEVARGDRFRRAQSAGRAREAGQEQRSTARGAGGRRDGPHPSLPPVLCALLPASRRRSRAALTRSRRPAAPRVSAPQLEECAGRARRDCCCPRFRRPPGLGWRGPGPGPGGGVGPSALPRQRTSPVLLQMLPLGVVGAAGSGGAGLGFRGSSSLSSPLTPVWPRLTLKTL